MQLEAPVVDGFLNSASQLYLPTSYRASALAQMEVLRRARGYRLRMYLAPEDYQETIPAYSQVEFQLQVQPGSYVYGFMFSTPFSETAPDYMYVQVTDACTETPFFSDYTKGRQLVAAAENPRRYPMLITPRLIGDPALLNAEIYNSMEEAVMAQLVIFVAEPTVPPETMVRELEAAGLLQAVR